MNDPIDRLLATSSILLVVGPGGVGKTTLSAALGARAALEHERKVLVVTVDPARRLADALGVAEIREEPVLVPLEAGQGSFWALMVDMGRSWDQLVERHAPDEQTQKALLANRLYRTLTQRFVQSHDYIALDHLVELTTDGRYDLVIVDTPPSVHALDVLDAPDRMIDFFGSRLLKWLIAPYGNRLVHAAAKPFLAVAERLLGGPFLSEITEFFWLFSRLQDTFVDRARLVKSRLSDSRTHYVIVQTPEPIPAERAAELARELRRRHHAPSLRIINRAMNPAIAGLVAADLDRVSDPDLRAAIDKLVHEVDRQASTVRVADDDDDADVRLVPLGTEPLLDLRALAALVEPLGE